MLAVMAGGMFLLFAAQYFIASQIVLGKYSEVEERLALAAVSRAQEVLRDNQRQLDSLAADWGGWDDAYQFMKTHDRRFIRSNFTPSTFERLDIDAAAYVANDGTILYQGGKISSGHEEVFPKEVLAFLKKDGALLRFHDESGHVSGLLQSRDGLWLVSSYPVITSDGKGPIRGAMVMLRQFNQALIGRLSTISNLSLSLHPVSTVSSPELLDALKRIADKNRNVLVDSLDEYRMAGYTLLDDALGNPSVLLRITEDRGLPAQGQLASRYQIWSALLIAIVLGLVTVLFERGFIDRLSIVTGLVKRIGDSRDLESRIPHIPGRDELSSLAENINQMLQRLQDSQHALVESEQQLDYQASHDALTGLANRPKFELLLQQALADAQFSRRDHCLAYFDLDQFKVVNDTCGHLAGDLLLREVADLLKNRLRTTDSLARLGGDEFGLLLMGCGIDEARPVIETLLQALREYRFAYEDKVFKIGASVGLSEINAEHRGSAYDLLSTVDAACYAAKEEGGGRIHAYHADDQALRMRHTEMSWISRIHEGLEKNLFRVYIQRMKTLMPGGEVHAELLIRMHGEDGTVYAPGYFLPAAERYHLMPLIDRWMVHEALKLMATPGNAFDGVCAINLSGQTVTEEDFPAYVTQEIAASGIDPARICFEITESAVIANLNKARHFMATLKSLGCRFSLDDFGSGLSSFGYLKNLDVDFLKIDGMFIKAIVNNPIDRAMVESINHVGHVMGLHTIAEFAENEDIIRVLGEIGVDYAQGYGVAKPELIQ